MAVFDAIGHSPVSASIVILCISVAITRELLLASDRPSLTGFGKRLGLPLIFLVLLFALVTVSRIVLMFTSSS